MRHLLLTMKMDGRVARNAAESVRNLALQIPFSFGPFNSLSVPGKSLESIVYLAVGLHGWWKSRETTNSLVSVIKMQNPDNELLCAPSFELAIFQAIETDHPFHGAVISDEENGVRVLRNVQLDGPTTRGEDEPKAILCMRALTSGLLCLFSRKDVVDVLFNIMQKCLIQFYQPDVQFDKHGPFSRALNDWIESERTKESFRKKSPNLMKELDAAALEFMSVSVKDLQSTQFFEIELVIAFLQWLFAEEYKHDPAIKRNYPTRSFHVWSLAFILNKLGFLVEASTTPIQDRETWESQISNNLEPNYLWRVYLVTSNLVFADLSYNHRPYRRMDFREKRIVPIGSIPTIAFEYFRYYKTPDLDSNFLNEVFNFVFSDVTDQLPSHAYLRALADLTGVPSKEQPPRVSVTVPSQMTSYQQYKLEDWMESPEISQLLSRSIRKYIPDKCPDECGKKRCHYPVIPFEDSAEISEEADQWKKKLRTDHNLMKPWITMHIIMLAFAYAVACQFIEADDGKRADLDTEICWTPIRFFENREDWEKVRLIIPDGDLKTWVRTMSDMLNVRLEPLDHIPTEKWPQHRRLKKTLFHMICGHRSEVFKIFETRDVVHDYVLGCSANSLSLISKILINPSANASDLHLYCV